MKKPTIFGISSFSGGGDGGGGAIRRSNSANYTTPRGTTESDGRAIREMPRSSYLPSPPSSPPHPFMFVDVPSAPVIGYHPKDHESLAPFDPLLLSDTSNKVNRNHGNLFRMHSDVSRDVLKVNDNSFVKKMPPSTIVTDDDHDSTPLHIGCTITPSTMREGCDSAPTTGHKKVIMNTNFYDSDYPEPPNLSTLNKWKKNKHKKSNSLQDSPLGGNVTSAKINIQTCTNNHKCNNSPPLHRFRKMAPKPRPDALPMEASSVHSVLTKPTSIKNRSKSSPSSISNDSNRSLWHRRTKQKEFGISDGNDSEHVFGDEYVRSWLEQQHIVSSNHEPSYSPKKICETSATARKVKYAAASEPIEGAKPVPTSFLTGKEEMIRSSEQNASGWQLEIPPKVELDTTAKLCHFIENYHSMEHYMDLNKLIGCSRLELSQFVRTDYHQLRPITISNGISSYHRPVVEMLLECGSDIVGVKGYFHSSSASSKSSRGGEDERDDIGECADGRDIDANGNDPKRWRESLILERDRQFICVIRGTTVEQQNKNPYLGLYKQKRQLQKLHHPATNIGVLPNGKSNDSLSAGSVTVFSDVNTALSDLEMHVFAMLDELTHTNPFYDVVFCGHSYGSALATLAAYKYACTRPSIRVAAYCSQTMNWTVGLHDFRLGAHSTPNLKIIRLEHGHSKSPLSSFGGCHVGHVIRMCPSPVIPADDNSDGKNADKEASLNDQLLVHACKFGFDYRANVQKEYIHNCQNHQQLQQSPVMMIHRLSSKISRGIVRGGVGKEKDIANYVSALDGLKPHQWVTSYSNEHHR